MTAGTNVHEIASGIYRISTPVEPVTEADILEPSETFRRKLDYYAHPRDGRRHLERLASLEPSLLACMHGSAWRGDGGKLIRALADSIER
jgi:hypothetical protein